MFPKDENPNPKPPAEPVRNLRFMVALAGNRNSPCVALSARNPSTGVIGILAVMIGENRKPYARALRKIAETLPHNPSEKHVLHFDYDTPIERLFDWMSECRHDHFHGRYELDGIVMEMAGFIGTATCQRVSRALTQRGCPSHLP